MTPWLSARFDSPGAIRRLGLLLLLSFLPSLTFLGHWPRVEIPIPGSDSYILVPGTGVEESTHPAHSHDDGGSIGGQAHTHEQHCHANLASCSDVPLTTISPVAHMAEAIGLLGADGAFTAVHPVDRNPGPENTVEPQLQPPKP
jgi:hypothetical protein